jgi:hypothetical protein
MEKKNREKLVAIIAFSIINSVFFLVSMLISDISFLNCLLYSLINGLWMPFILIPMLEKITSNRAIK